MSNSYAQLARQYADGVAVLFTPVAAGPAEGRVVGVAPQAETAVQHAERLSGVSAQLTSAIAADLAAEDSAVRGEAATALLAKAYVDLQIGAYLWQLDQPPAGRSALPSVKAGTIQPPSVDLAVLPEYLSLLTGMPAPGSTRGPAVTPTGSAVPADLFNARQQLSLSIQSALSLIEERAATNGQAALSGLLVLGFGRVVQAATIVGLDIAEALGSGEAASQLVNQVRGYVTQAYNAIVALLGPALTKMAAQQVVAWVNDIAQGKQFARLLASFYQTGQTRQQLAQIIEASTVGVDRYDAAIKQVDTLGKRFGKQMEIVGKLLQAFRLVSGAAVVALPQGTVIMAAAYIALAAFIILEGADYVDAQRIKPLNLVPGVRKAVEAQLM